MSRKAKIFYYINTKKSLLFNHNYEILNVFFDTFKKSLFEKYSWFNYVPYYITNCDRTIQNKDSLNSINDHLIKEKHFFKNDYIFLKEILLCCDTILCTDISNTILECDDLYW